MCSLILEISESTTQLIGTQATLSPLIPYLCRVVYLVSVCVQGYEHMFICL